MGKSLKDALMKAGFQSAKSENHRESSKGRERKASEKHQHARNFCEHCNSHQPDVEKYKHHNPTTEAEWICVACADKLMISDDCRVTNQSNFSKQGNFTRYFGHTKQFSKHSDSSARPQRNRNRNGNVAGRRPERNTKGPRNGNR